MGNKQEKSCGDNDDGDAMQGCEAKECDIGHRALEGFANIEASVIM